MRYEQFRWSPVDRPFTRDPELFLENSEQNTRRSVAVVQTTMTILSLLYYTFDGAPHCASLCRETKLQLNRRSPIECAEISAAANVIRSFRPTDASARPVRTVTAVARGYIATAVSSATRPTRGGCNTDRRRTRFLKRFLNRVSSITFFTIAGERRKIVLLDRPSNASFGSNKSNRINNYS